MHGKTSRIHHRGTGLFTGLPSPFRATRYHSLVIAPASVPEELEVVATSEDGEIMAVQHVRDPVYGVQFHPESVLTEQGYRLVDHFLHGVPATPRSLPLAADGALVASDPGPSSLASNPPPADLVR
jgi:anthranilate synthase/aminodeoxychorismate synthase-like glutamine amidotransferase